MKALMAYLLILNERLALATTGLAAQSVWAQVKPFTERPMLYLILLPCNSS